MCMGSTPKAPKAPPKLPEAPVAPGASMEDDGTGTKRRSKAGAAGTILTGARGLGGGTTTAGAGKTLLGS